MTELVNQMIKAVEAGDSTLVTELVQSNPALANAKDEAGQSAVLLAVYYGHREMVGFLVSHGATLDVFAASAVGDESRVAELVRDEPGLINRYSSDGFTPLGLAAHFGHREVVELLLERGAEVNAVSRNATGYTALTGAVAAGHMAITELLLSRGADVNVKYTRGFTPLHTAAFNGNVGMVELLLSAGADTQAKTTHNKTPLAYALEQGHKDVADVLQRH